MLIFFFDLYIIVRWRKVEKGTVILLQFLLVTLSLYALPILWARWYAISRISILHHCIMTLPSVEHSLVSFSSVGTSSLRRQSLLSYCSSSSTSSWFFLFFMNNSFICFCNIALSASNRVILLFCLSSCFFYCTFHFFSEFFY